MKLNRDQLIALMKSSKVGIVVGLLISAISAISYFWSKDQLIRLDQQQLDTPFVEEESIDP